MPVLKPRSRLVYFRISEDEFRQIQRLCETTGARSISDLARSAVQRLISEQSEAAPKESRDGRQALDTVVFELRETVGQLRELLSTWSGATPGIVRNPETSAS